MLGNFNDIDGFNNIHIGSNSKISKIRGDNDVTVSNRVKVYGDDVVMFGHGADSIYYQSQDLKQYLGIINVDGDFWISMAHILILSIIFCLYYYFYLENKQIYVLKQY